MGLEFEREELSGREALWNGNERGKLPAAIMINEIGGGNGQQHGMRCKL